MNEYISTGIEQLDDVLDGGLLRGSLCEIQTESDDLICHLKSKGISYCHINIDDNGIDIRSRNIGIIKSLKNIAFDNNIAIVVIINSNNNTTYGYGTSFLCNAALSYKDGIITILKNRNGMSGIRIAVNEIVR